MQGLELRTATATLKDLELRLNTQSVDQQKKRAEEEADTVRALDSAETHNESASSGPSANDYFDIESRVLKALERPPSTGLRFRPRVEIRAHESDVAPLLLDGLYICAPPADRDVIVEIKVAESGLAFRNAAEQLLASVTRYEDISGRPARGWLIGITNLAQRSRRERDVRALLGGRGSVNLLPVEDLDALELIAVPH